MTVAPLESHPGTTAVTRHSSDRPPHGHTTPDACSHAQRIAASLKLIEQHVPIQRRVLRTGDTVYSSGERFTSLHIVHSGFFKLVNLTADGREHLVALHFKGDWLGFDGIAGDQHGCDAIAMDTGEIWTIRYDTLMRACVEHAPLLAELHGAMSRQMRRERDSLMSLCTLPADARVADFLYYWVESLERRGLRTDQVTLRMTRAEIGNYLGMRLESVSRAFSRLEREQVICFTEKGRRDVQISDVGALARFAQQAQAPNAATMQ